MGVSPPKSRIVSPTVSSSSRQATAVPPVGARNVRTALVAVLEGRRNMSRPHLVSERRRTENRGVERGPLEVVVGAALGHPIRPNGLGVGQRVARLVRADRLES